jgi:ketosteroid isomerase-like protein
MLQGCGLMSDSNVAVVEQLFAAFARRDADAMVALLDPEAVFEPASTEIVARETYAGHAGMRRYLADVAATWEEFRVSIHEYRAVGDRVLARGRVYARARSPAFIADNEIDFVWHLRDGLIVRGGTVLDPHEAERELHGSI